MKFRPIQPKSGEKHVIFGKKYKQMHQLADHHWTADDKIEQYNAIVSVYEKSHILQNEEKLVQDKLKADHMKEQTKQLLAHRKVLHETKYGKVQVVKNLFKNHKDLQRVYPSKPLDSIIYALDLRIYNKRKYLDRLLYERAKISDLYKTKLMEISELQDRIEYQDFLQLPDNARANQLALEIQNAKIRINTIETLNKCSMDFIKMAMNDSLYFSPILNTIQEDADEQEDILNRTLKLGGPAIENLKKLKEYFGDVSEESMKKFNIRIATLMRARDNLKENAMRIRGLIQNDYQVQINRYVRETPSMMDIKMEFDGIEKSVQALIAATASSGVDQIFERFEQEIKRNELIKSKIQTNENEYESISENIRASALTKCSKEENFTKDNINDLEQMNEAQQLIELELNEQLNCNENAQNIGHVILDLKKSFLHFDKLLQHVNGNEQMPNDKQYLQSYLKLPYLVKYDSPTMYKNNEMRPIEDDLNVLIESVSRKAGILMDAYNDEADDDFNHEASTFYHDAVLKKLNNKVIEMPTRSLSFGPVLDKSVPNRATIKAISHKIVLQNAKKED